MKLLYEQAFERALGMIDERFSRNEILSYLAQAAQTASGPDTVASILLVDKNGLLRNGASPGLPFDYLQAIDGLMPHPNVGTCAAAAATGAMVITEDFCSDNKWAELRHLPLSLGFKGAWSMPIKDSNGQVLGTFGTYFNQKRLPSEGEIQGVKLLSDAAALALTQATND